MPRATFAFNGGQPYQQQGGGLSGNSAGARTVGGDSQGGVETAGPVTFANGNDGIPEFLANAMEPYVRRKQQEQMYKGYDAAASGKAYKEITQSDSGIASIFGPSYYHQGAAMYEASTKVEQATNDMANDQDLYKMDDASRSSEISKRYNSTLTGDPVADSIIHQKILEVRAPLVNALTKKNFAYGQQQGVLAAQGAADASATSYQTLAQTQSAMTAPTDEDKTALDAARTSFLASFVRPHGMTDESYQSFLASSAKRMQVSGNFYGYEAMKDAGLLNPGGPLTDDQISKLETGYDANASRVFSDAAHDPTINRALSILNTDIIRGEVRSPYEVAQRAETINAQMAAMTGIRGRAFISEDSIVAMQKDLVNGQFQAGLRVMERQWQVADRQATWEHEEQMQDRKTAAAIAGANTMLSAGSLGTGLATGVVKEPDANLVVGQAIAAGNLAPLAANYASGRYVNSFGAQQMQSAVANSIGIGVTKSFEGAYKQWQALHAENPAAATAYFGDYAANMEGYDRQLRAGEQPVAAYAATFGKGPDLGRIDLPPGVKEADFRSSVQDAIRGQDKWMFGFAGSRTPLSTSAMNLVTNIIEPQAAAYARSSGISTDVAAKKLYDNALASGMIERAGPLAWQNQSGVPKLSRLLALPDESTDQLITQVLDKRLKASGFAAGASADDYVTLRVTDAHGNPALYVQAPNKDGSGHTDVAITLDELKAANRREAVAALPDDKAGKPALKFKLDFNQYTSKADAKANAEFKTGPGGHDIGHAAVKAVEAVAPYTPAALTQRGLHKLFVEGIPVASSATDRSHK